jgi:hypothetical protein
MAAGAASLVLAPDHRSGTTWLGFRYLVEDSVDEEATVWTPRDLTDYSAHAQFRDETGAILMDLTLGSGIEIPDPVEGVVYVDGLGVLTAAPGLMVFDVKLTHPGGEKTVELDGSQTIVAGVTV